MFVRLVVFLLCGEISSVVCQSVGHAEKRVLTGPGMDYATYQQFAAGQPGLSAYSDFSMKTTQSSKLSDELPKNIRTIILTKKVPVPYPVHVEKKVPFPVKVPIRRPYTVYVPKPYLVEVMKQVPVPVKVPIPQPYTVEKHVPVPYKVHYDKPYPVHVSKPYPVFYEKRVPIHIEKPVPIPYKVAVDRPVPVHIPLEKPVLYPVERPFPFPVKVPVDKPVPSHVEKPLAVPVTVEKPHLASSEHSSTAAYYSSTQPTVYNTFSPSPYDEMTSSLITQGKHKVMSFLPGSQNNLGSYTDHTDVGTIHVSNIKGNSGNSSDWIPKQYVPNTQYLTYIPNTPAQQKYIQYVIPGRTAQSSHATNSEPYVLKQNSLKMHYKLHFDPSKQEYSFQLVPRGPVTDLGGHPSGYSFQSTKTESKSQPSDQANTQTEYVYKPSPEASETNRQIPSKSTDSHLTYSYQQVYQEKPDLNVNHPGFNSQDASYSYQSAVHQSPTQFKHQDTVYSFPAIDAASKPHFDPNSHVASQPEVTYTYHQQVQASDGKPTYQEQPHNTDQPHVSYSYQTVNSDGKTGYDFQSQLKNHEAYPSEQVSYMYIPQGSSTSFHGVRENSNSDTSYGISPETGEISTEYPQILYQQGRPESLLRDQYITTQPTLSSQGRIPENFKTARASEGLTLYNMESETNNSEATSDGESSRGKSVINNYRQVNNPQEFNDTKPEGGTMSVTYEKFGVADVMNPLKTQLFYVNGTTSSVQSYPPVGHDGSFELTIPDHTHPTTSEMSYHGKDSGNFSPTDHPFSTEVYRLSTYKVPKPRKTTKRKNKKEAAQTEVHTLSRDDGSEKTTTAIAWYQIFNPDLNAGQPNKDTNSHTGAAERAPFFGYSTSVDATTTSSSILPPEVGTADKPTQSVRVRSRGSVRAYGRKKEETSTTTEGYDSSSTKGTRRRRRPARRRMDASDSPLIEMTV